MATAVSDKQRSNIVNNSECTPGSESKSSIQNGSTDVDSDVNVSSGVNKHSVPFSMNQYVQAEGPKTPGEGAGSKPGGPMDSVPVEGMPQGPYGGRTMHGEQLMHDSPSQYGPQGIRHPFGGKLSMNPPRSPGSMFSQQRFMSGQSISQPTGPTPTLNQLLQTSNAIQRMQNSYGPGEPTGVYGPQQGWLTHPMYVQGAPNPGPQAYRNPSPPFRPAQSSTPTANAPEAGELAGQNSNDSCSGGAGGGAGPGTPNSQQGMRPTPSPTGSTGSRSMSPAVGQQNIQMPPRPSSGQSDGGGTGGRMSHSPMGVGPGYQGPPAPPHLSGYKLSSGPAPGPSQPLPPYSSQQQPPPHGQFSPSPQGNYAVRPQGNMQYGSNQVYGGLPNTGPPNTGPGMGPSQYPGRSMPNHFSSYSQTWGGAATPASKPSPTVSQPSSPANAQSPRPPHYLKTHLQHKMGYGGGIVPSHSPPQNYPGPGPGPVGMGPPGGMHHPGPMPMGPPPIGSGHMNMGPPHMAPPVSTNSHDGAPMPPPCSTPNPQHGPDSDSAHDNGITTTAGGAGTHITPSVTSVVTTGPDGTPLDEGSQQSTLSNASVASGEDPQCSSSKSRKNELGSGGSGAGHYSHPATPQSTAPSPGAASMNSVHADEYDISSPGWPRTPASPVFNSHAPPPETYRSKKTDSLSKLYEMDDSPERRAWLDKLLAFMEERRTPITTCPTISKNPLDLFRLYIYVKDRGGFMEVCKVTKNKTWKDIAGMLGIGASSSAAYTLRKHYTKNLLAYECKFDRGGIDPQPIINQVESTSKKKGAKAASVPSPGSSNSQDSFPTPGSGGASMDGYNAYYPPGSTPDYNSPPMPRPSSQANAPSPHPGNHQQGDNISVSNPFDDVASGQQRYPGGPVGAQGPGGPYTGPGMPPRSQGYAAGYNQYPPPGNSPDPYQSYSNNSAYPSTTRPMGYPSYSPDGDRPAAFNQSSSNSMTTSMASNMSGSSPSASTASPGHDPYGRYGMSTGGQSGGYPPPPPRPGYSAPAPGSGPGGPGPGPGPSPAANQPGPQQPPAPYPAQSEYYRNDSNYPSGGGQTSPVSGGASNQVYGNGPHSKTMPPPAPQPRRHPDFAKDQQQYPPYSQQKSQMYGWPNNQYRGQYSGQNTVPPAGQQWNQSGVARGAVPTTGGTPPASGPGGPAWGGPEHRYPLTAQTGAGPGAAPGPGYQPGPGHQPVPGQQWPPVSQSPNIRPAVRPTFRPEGKPFNMPPPQGLKTAPGLTNSSYTQQPLPKREITFPPDSVEATVPVLYRRKRLCRADVAPLDAWRIMMCLRSGLLAESTWALDVLNVLLYDDSSIAYFGLSHLPGMLDILLEHFERSLSDMFDGPTAEIESRPETNGDVDLGAVTKTPDPNDRTVLLHNTPSYSMTSRKGRPVRVIPKDEDIFILDNQKDWDVDGEQSVTAEVTPGPWHLVSSSEIAASTKHIVTCFQAEFGNIPFARLLPTKLRDEVVVKIEEQTHVDGDSEDDKKRTKTLSEVVVDTIKEENRKTEETEETKLDVRDPAGTLKRRRISDYEDEAYSRDEASLHLVTETQDCVGKRCACISNILRNLTFVPGNELEFAKSQCFLGLVGKLLLLHHEHPARAQKTRNYDREEDADFGDTCSSLQAETEWWWDYLTQVRENVLVAVANIAGHVDLAPFEEEVSRPVLDGLLHWAVCPSAHGQDPFQSLGPTSSLSPQRLALEALCKLCVTDSNVDLVIATPPYSRLERLCGILTKLLCRSEEQVLREFAVNLLHYLAAADSGVARSIALQSPCVSLLVAFIEQAEQSALSIANQHGIGALRENPDAMGTSLDMLRRAAHTLLHLSRHPDNRPLFLQQEQRLLALVMSQILDQQVASVISRVLFQVSRVPPEHPDTS